MALLSVIGLTVTTLCGDETRSSGRAARQVQSARADQEPLQREPIRIAQRREQNDLDPSIEESPALPADSQGSESAASRAQPELTAQQPATDGARSIGDSTNAWPQPAALLAELDQLSRADTQSADWSTRVKTEIDQLISLPSMGHPSAPGILGRLEELAEESRQIAGGLTVEDDRSRILRAGFAIVRRLALWRPAQLASQREGLTATLSPAEAAHARQRLRSIVVAAEGELQPTGDARPWRAYLLLDPLTQELARSDGPAPSLRSLSRELLYRMHSTQLSQVQADFLQSPTFRAMAAELKVLATEPADLAEVLAAVETYEQSGNHASAARLADLYDRLRWSVEPHVAELAQAVNTYYRNANVRVAVSAELVNRLLPGETTVNEPVVDRIQGAHVEGASQTSTKVRLVLLPTRGQWEFGIEAVGDVASNTTSSSGPARFNQSGWSNFRARKRLTVDRRGIRLFQAEAEANADTQLHDFETEFDGIPIFGSLARAIARSQYEQKSPAAKSEVEGKISYRASSELDKQVAEKLEQAKQDFQKQMVRPLQELQLEPTALDMETTQERLIARYRLAGRDQVSAYTPRPQAPGDSLLSVQIHESALNNVLSHLKLEGRRVDLVTLFREMNDRFSDKKVPVPEDIPDDVFITFDDADSVRIDCEDGHVRLTIHLKSLEQGGEVRWRDLTVIARYKPDSDQLDANLVRDGIFELPRTRGAGDRVALSAIFGKILNRNRKLNLINERISKSPQLKDQQVTQFVIHDGWIGVALGPKTAERQAQLEQAAPQ